MKRSTSLLNRLPQHVATCARSLEELGLSEVAWPREAVDKVLIALKDSSVAVLGGDAYAEQDQRLSSTYDNWYCERHPRESLASYAARSWQEAWKYIERYPESEAPIYFALVLSDEPTAGL